MAIRFGLFWQTPGYEGSAVSRQRCETIEEIVLAEQLGFEGAWLAESVFFPTRPMSNPLLEHRAPGSASPCASLRSR